MLMHTEYSKNTKQFLDFDLDLVKLRLNETYKMNFETSYSPRNQNLMLSIIYIYAIKQSEKVHLDHYRDAGVSSIRLRWHKNTTDSWNWIQLIIWSKINIISFVNFVLFCVLWKGANSKRVHKRPLFHRIRSKSTRARFSPAPNSDLTEIYNLKLYLW